MMFSPAIKRTLFFGSLFLLSILSILFVEGYRLHFDRRVTLEKKGVLVLQGKEKDVLVRLDNTIIKTSLPYVTTALSLGNHHLEIFKAGYNPITESLYIDEHRATVREFHFDRHMDFQERYRLQIDPKRTYFVLNRTDLGEYFPGQRTLFIYSRFEHIAKRMPETKVTFPANFSTQTPDLIRKDGSTIYIRLQGKTFLFDTNTREIVDVLLPEGFTDLFLGSSSPVEIFFDRKKQLYEKLFQQPLQKIIQRTDVKHYYVIGAQNIFACTALLPSYCTQLHNLPFVPEKTMFWEEDETFILFPKESTKRPYIIRLNTQER